jgi:hypothetical protein
MLTETPSETPTLPLETPPKRISSAALPSNPASPLPSPGRPARSDGPSELERPMLDPSFLIIRISSIFLSYLFFFCSVFSLMSRPERFFSFFSRLTPRFFSLLLFLFRRSSPRQVTARCCNVTQARVDVRPFFPLRSPFPSIYEPSRLPHVSIFSCLASNVTFLPFLFAFFHIHDLIFLDLETHAHSGAGLVRVIVSLLLSKSVRLL